MLTSAYVFTNIAPFPSLFAMEPEATRAAESQTLDFLPSKMWVQIPWLLLLMGSSVPLRTSIPEKRPFSEGSGEQLAHLPKPLPLPLDLEPFSGPPEF